MREIFFLIKQLKIKHLTVFVLHMGNTYVATYEYYISIPILELELEMELNLKKGVFRFFKKNNFVCIR